MKTLHVVMFCCFSACVKTSEVLEVSGQVGGEVSINCSVGWTTDNSSELDNVYFCKGECSRENILIQVERERSAETWRGRYSMEVNRGDGVFNVTIKKLKRRDAGRYCCGMEKTFNELYQEVNLVVLNASGPPPGSPLSTNTMQTEAETPRGSFPSSTESSPAALPLPTTGKTKQSAMVNLTDTTVVIIVSVSLALLVCALIPLVFYGHWRSNAEGQSGPEANKGEADSCEESADGASPQDVVRLQVLEPDPGSCAQDASQYAAIYQALDPTALE